MEGSGKAYSIQKLEAALERIRKSISNQTSKYGVKYEAELLLHLERKVIFLKTGL